MISELKVTKEKLKKSVASGTPIWMYLTVGKEVYILVDLDFEKNTFSYRVTLDGETIHKTANLAEAIESFNHLVEYK